MVSRMKVGKNCSIVILEFFTVIIFWGLTRGIFLIFVFDGYPWCQGSAIVVVISDIIYLSSLQSITK